MPQQAPPSPAPPAAPVITVQVPGASFPLGQLPRSPEEVRGLRERREILRDQLARATNRREELVEELNETGAQEARAGIQQRLNLLDERILQLERDQAATEQLLSNAPPAVLAMTQPVSSGGNEEDMFGFWVFGLAVGVVLTMILGRFRRRRAAKRGGRGPAAVTAGTERRLDELTDAVHAIAEEVERIGEGQRFVTNLLASKREPAGIGSQGGAAQPR